jgi:superoxide dismutase
MQSLSVFWTHLAFLWQLQAAAAAKEDKELQAASKAEVSSLLSLKKQLEEAEAGWVGQMLAKLLYWYYEQSYHY